MEEIQTVVSPYVTLTMHLEAVIISTSTALWLPAAAFGLEHNNVGGGTDAS
jgi:hypothetical protein